MSSKMRWRYSDTNPVNAAVDSEIVIEIGDLVWQDVDDAKPASSQADQSSETANQELFADNFLGVAMQRSQAGDTDPIRVATTGTFEFDCPSGTFELGDLMGLAVGERVTCPNCDKTFLPSWSDDCLSCPQCKTRVEDRPKQDKLLSQGIARVPTAKYAVARVAKRVAVPATNVLVDIRSTVMTGGILG